MRRSDAEDRLKAWYDGDRKVFRYFRALAPTEYVVFGKESNEQFRAHPDVSTYKLPDMDAETFIRMMMSGELTYDRDHTYSCDTHYLKTGGCTCGSWVLRDNDYLHTPGCKKYRG